MQIPVSQHDKSSREQNEAKGRTLNPCKHKVRVFLLIPFFGLGLSFVLSRMIPNTLSLLHSSVSYQASFKAADSFQQPMTEGQALNLEQKMKTDNGAQAGSSDILDPQSLVNSDKEIKKDGDAEDLTEFTKSNIVDKPDKVEGNDGERDPASNEQPISDLVETQTNETDKVNENNEAIEKSTENKTQESFYRVRKDWADKKSQIGAFVKKENAIELAKKNSGYKVYDPIGNEINEQDLSNQSHTQQETK